ncbi:MAG: response regulator transcription factor [Sediminibacterium sp.]|nr:response regulator transcription factor [Sediminibacterium sp.]
MHTIALADNYPPIRGSISSLITNLPGHAVSIEADNGYQLVKQISCLNKLPAIAILDIQMPVMDGVYTTHFLTSHYPAIKVLAISCHNHPDMVMDMLSAGASGFLVKDNLSGRLLLKAFAAILSGNTFIDETINNQETFLSLTSRTTLPNTWHSDITEKEKKSYNYQLAPFRTIRLPDC